MPRNHKKKIGELKKRSASSGTKRPLYLRKRFYVVLLILFFLFATFLAVVGVQTQQQYRSNAIAATTLSFSPSTVNANIGDTIPLTITIIPGQISFHWLSLK